MRSPRLLLSRNPGIITQDSDNYSEEVTFDYTIDDCRVKIGCHATLQHLHSTYLPPLISLKLRRGITWQTCSRMSDRKLVNHCLSDNQQVDTSNAERRQRGSAMRYLVSR